MLHDATSMCTRTKQCHAADLSDTPPDTADSSSRHRHSAWQGARRSHNPIIFDETQNLAVHCCFGYVLIDVAE